MKHRLRLDRFWPDLVWSPEGWAQTEKKVGHRLQAAGVSHYSPRAQTCTCEGPPLQKHHQIPRNDPGERQKNTRRPQREKKKTRDDPPEGEKRQEKTTQREKKRTKLGREREKKKREILGGPAEGGPVVGPNSVGA